MSITTNTITARIRCIKKTDRYSPHERIRAIGGMNSDGSRWKLSTDDAIRRIENGTNRFYVERPTGDRVYRLSPAPACSNGRPSSNPVRYSGGDRRNPRNTWSKYGWSKCRRRRERL